MAMAMAWEPFYMVMSKVVKINLKGKPSRYATAKDMILGVLRILTVKSGVGKILE